MKITKYALNMSRESVLSHYELKMKQEERSANIIITLIMFSIFILIPFLVTRMIFEATGWMDDSMLLLDIIIIESFVIVIMAVCLTTNAYRCGKLFKSLRKNQNLNDTILYMMKLGYDNPQFYIAYILLFCEYQYSYITDEDKLVVVYSNGMIERRYTTYMFEMLCDKDCDNATLSVTESGIQII